MRFDLNSDTDLAVHALFDPALLLNVINNPDLTQIDEDALEGRVRRGDVLLYSNACDGRVQFRCFLDEEPDGGLAALAYGRKDNLLLRVPSGRLFATGIEYPCRPGQRPLTPAEFEAQAGAMGQGVDLLPGNYVVDAFEVATWRVPAANQSPWPAKLFPLGAAITLLGTVVAATFVLIGLFCGKMAWAATGLVAWGVGLIALWFSILLVTAIVGHVPRRREKREAGSAGRPEFDAILVFRRLPPDFDPSPLRGGRFGSAYEES
jgi:hypothetical protein